jgi:hypothetical protein
MGLIVNRNPSIALSKQIGDSINRRFHTFSRGSKEVVATPKTHEYIELEIHPRYVDNLSRYMHVVRSLPIREMPAQRQLRLVTLERQLLDHVTAATAAIRLEAVGKEAIPVLKQGLESSDPEVRFYAAEALAYLDESQAVPVLGESIRREPAFRVYALAALGAMDDMAANEQLLQLLSEPSAETRYGAFRALWTMRNKVDPIVRGEDMHGQFYYHLLKTSGPPMVHVTRSFRPEVVVFGGNQPLATPILLEAGNKILVRDAGRDQIAISRFSSDPNEQDQKRTVPATVDDLIRGIVDVGGTYPDVVQALREAKASGALTARFEVEAIPRVGRRYDRSSTTANASREQDSATSIESPAPGLFATDEEEHSTSDEAVAAPAEKL